MEHLTCSPKWEVGTPLSILKQNSTHNMCMLTAYACNWPHTQVQRRGRRNSAWYTLFAHAFNHHGILWRPCMYVYVCILLMSYTRCVDVPVGVLSFISMPSGS